MSWLRKWEAEDERRDLKRSVAKAEGSRSTHEGVKPAGCVLSSDLKAANDRRNRLHSNNRERLVELAGAMGKGEKAIAAGIGSREFDSSRQDRAGAIRRGGVATLASRDSRDSMLLAEIVAGRIEVM